MTRVVLRSAEELPLRPGDTVELPADALVDGSIVAHLPGQHDQADHAGGQGKSRLDPENDRYRSAAEQEGMTVLKSFADVGPEGWHQLKGFILSDGSFVGKVGDDGFPTHRQILGSMGAGMSMELFSEFDGGIAMFGYQATAKGDDTSTTVRMEGSANVRQAEAIAQGRRGELIWEKGYKADRYGKREYESGRIPEDASDAIVVATLTRPPPSPITAHLPDQHDQSDHNPHKNINQATEDELDEIGRLANTPSEPSQNQRLSNHQRAAIENYANHGYLGINRALRSDEASLGAWVSIREIDSAFGAIEPTREPRTLFRGMDYDQELDKVLQPGVVFEDKGYLSTSRSEITAEGKAGMLNRMPGQADPGFLVEIEAPAGVRMIDVTSARIEPFGAVEQEELLPRGCRLEIVDRGGNTIFARLVGYPANDGYEEFTGSVVAHLPGQHDQADHAPNGGSESDSRSAAYHKELIDSTERRETLGEGHKRAGPFGTADFLMPDGSVQTLPPHEHHMYLAEKITGFEGLDALDDLQHRTGAIRTLMNERELGVSITNRMPTSAQIRQIADAGYGVQRTQLGRLFNNEGKNEDYSITLEQPSEAQLTGAFRKILEGAVVAHLPGQHEQADHNPHDGGGVATATRESRLPKSMQDHMSAQADRILSGDYHLPGWRSDYAQEYADRIADNTAKNAAKHEMTPEEYIRAANNNAQRIVDNAELWTRLPPQDFEKVLNDGRFKSQYESKHSSPGGVFDPQHRRERETQMFGDRPEYGSRNATRAPIYGYLADRDQVEASGKSDGMDLYGLVRVRLKDEMVERTTVSFGDSLAGSHPSPATALDVRTELAGDGDPLNWTHASTNYPSSEGGVSIEAQFHGGLKVEDIAEIRLPTREMIDNWYLPGNARDAITRPYDPGTRKAPSANEAWDLVNYISQVATEMGIPVQTEYVEPGYERNPFGKAEWELANPRRGR